MPAIGSSNKSARHRHTHHSKHWHHRQGHGPQPRRTDDRQPGGQSLTVIDHLSHSKEGLIHSWLQGLRAPKLRPEDEVGHLAGKSIPSTRSPAQPAHPSPGCWTPHGLQLPEGYRDPHPLSGTCDGRQRRRRDRALDEDSSIIVPIHDRLRNSAETPSCYYERGKRKQQVDSEASDHNYGASSPADHQFEKRARRKTRDDRYDTVKVDYHGRGKDPRTKPSNQSTKRGLNMSSAREVMNNFNSNTILNDRITVSTVVLSPPPTPE